MKWREEKGGPVMRTLLGRMVAKVNFTGTHWRVTIWTRHGSSTFTTFTLAEAMTWCEMELWR